LLQTLLVLQRLDLQIENCKARELEIPKQKEKFDLQKRRLVAELEERERTFKALQVEQRECESENELKQVQIDKYQQQLFAIKKNEEYQALLHEIDGIRKQILLKEERIIALMVEIDDTRSRLDADRKRVKSEQESIDRQCAKIDAELNDAIQDRKRLETQRGPLSQSVNSDLLARYERVRQSKKTGPAVVELNGQVCSGCHMYVLPQMANEVLAGKKFHACNHCGRLLYHKDNVTNANADVENPVRA
jgi:uncharacterized protein